MVTISRAEYERLQQEKARNAKLEAKLAAREQEQAQVITSLSLQNEWLLEQLKLSRRLTDILGVRTKVENCVLTAADNDELTNMLRKIVLQISPEASKAKVIALSQCFMKDMSTQQDENEIRRKLYVKWVNYIKVRGVR